MTVLLVSGMRPVPTNCGHLIVPGAWNSIKRIVASGLPYACDNGCFIADKWSESDFRRMLDKVKGQPRLLWVAAPDVVADAAATLARFEIWEPELHGMGLPVALVAQDGLEDMDIPWSRFEALFIGGSTRWKLGPEAARIARETKEGGKWLHMGRVNSHRRLRYAQAIGCDSVDGTRWSRFAETYLERVVPILTTRQQVFKEFLT